MKEMICESLLLSRSLTAISKTLAVVLLSLGLHSLALAQPAKSNRPDLTRQSTLYVVGYAHLDTQWRWDYVRTIGQYIPDTMRRNFALIEKYPNYIFNFSGANRYRLMKEYYPADYTKVRAYVAAGRWFPAGSSVEESDVNVPSAESIFRQILYGNNFFRTELGRASAEYMLPDCFGFPASLPSILAHAGVKGFSTQKLSWGSAAAVGGPGSIEATPAGIPFNVGIWEGPDGRSVIAALDPQSYDGEVRRDLSKSTDDAPDPQTRNGGVDWLKRIHRNGQVAGLFADYHYYGTGDIGGAPRESSIELLEKIVTRGEALFPRPVRNNDGSTTNFPQLQSRRVGDGPLKVVSATAEQMFLDMLNTGQTARLPRYKGDLLLTEHSAGSISSETVMKRWNRHNELLADAAERASVTAAWLGARPYPLDRLNRAWTLVMGGQFHDILPGTSLPEAYGYSWNDEVLALNQFAGVLASATEAVAAGLNTQAKGTAIVVYNPLNVEREDVVEATLSFPGDPPAAVRVIGPDGREVPSQLARGNGTPTVLFMARVPSVGFAVYDVQPAKASPAATVSALKVTDSSLENSRYRLRVDANGDLASVFDKALGKEILAGPARLALQTEKPRDWPAWNMDWRDQQKPPRAYVSGPARVRIVENGPVRVALEIEREAEGSRFMQTIRLSAGDAGNRVEFSNAIDWRTSAAALKATFPLAAANPLATYNQDIGTIARANNNPTKYEVPSHQWFDLTDRSGAFGVTVLSDCKYGSDKPDDNTLRLTLLYTPGLGEGNGRDYADQTTQDWGHHEFIYGLASHKGDWRQGQTDWQAQRLNQPLVAFESAKHAGKLGTTFSLLQVSDPRVRVLALKKAEASDEVIVRLVELDGHTARNVRIAGPSLITAAREVNAQEEAVGPATVSRGELVTDFGPYQPRTFAVKLGAAPVRLASVKSQPVTLPYDLSVAGRDQEKTSIGFDAAGRRLPAEMLPEEIAYDAIRFNLAPALAGKPNAVVCRGQQIALPAGRFKRLYILAASSDGDQAARFGVGDRLVDLMVQDWSGSVGQWDARIWDGDANSPTRQYKGLRPGFIKRAPVAWFASHRHTADGANEIYQYAYLFAYAVDLPVGAKTLTLPNNEKVRVLAVTVADAGGAVRPAQALYDTLEREP